MAPEVTRWFYEMGEGGLVDFPALMKEIVTSGYDGWLTVEHDKAELGGGSYAEATAVAKWYIDNVLAEAEAEARAELETRAMKDTLRWAYALNQWNVRLDVFVRHEDQQRALKTVSACGFDTIELASGTGRWDNISRPEVILLNHGSHAGLPRLPAPAQGAGRLQHVLGPAGSPRRRRRATPSARRRTPPTTTRSSSRSKPFVDFVAGVGAEQLVVRPVGSAWMSPPLDADGIKVIGDVWNRIGELAAAVRRRARPALRLPGRRAHRSRADRAARRDRPGDWSASRWTPPSSPSAASTRWRSTGSTPTGSPTCTSRTPATPTPARSTGCPVRSRRCSRAAPDGGSSAGSSSSAPTAAWSTCRAFVAALRERNYPGWVVVESDHGGNPAELAMLNSWYLQHELGVAK